MAPQKAVAGDLRPRLATRKAMDYSHGTVRFTSSAFPSACTAARTAVPAPETPYNALPRQAALLRLLLSPLPP